jgi:molybdate transport system substrate-binding protein
MRQRTAAVAASACGVMLAGCIAAGAVELNVTSSNALKTTLEQLAPEFEKATGDKLVFNWGAGAVLKTAIEKGADFDVALLTTAAIDDLIRQGKLIGATRTAVATSLTAVAVRRGAPKPDLGTTEAFKRALLDAKSIALVAQGGTGIYMKALLPRLGIADALKDKIKLLPPENPAAKAVANGEAEIGITQISEILPYPGAEVAGPLPQDIQLADVFGAAINTHAREPQAGEALIKFLTAPAAAPVFKAKGLEPAVR